MKTWRLQPGEYYETRLTAFRTSDGDWTETWTAWKIVLTEGGLELIQELATRDIPEWLAAKLPQPIVLEM